MNASDASEDRLHWRMSAAGLVLLIGIAGSSLANPIEATALGEATKEAQDYPAARKTETRDIFHGVPVSDPYRWMEDLGSAELDEWIRAQNRLSNPRLNGDPAYDAIRSRLERLDGLYPQIEPGPEVGGRRYSLAWVGNAANLRVQERGANELRVVLDAEALGPGMELKAYEPSPDGQYVAYAVGNAGADWGEIRIRDLKSNRDLPEVLPHVRFGGPIGWSADCTGLVYRRFRAPQDGRLEAPAEEPALYLHHLGTQPGTDERLYVPEAGKEEWSLAFNLPGERRQLFIYVERGPWGDGNIGGSRAQVVVLDLEQDGRPWSGAKPRTLTQPDASYRVLHVEAGRALVFTDRNSPLRQLVSIDLEQPDPSVWRVIIPQGHGVIKDARWYGGRLVVHSIEDVRSVVRVFDGAGKYLHDIRLPSTGVADALVGHATSSNVQLFYSGLLQAPVMLDHDLVSGTTRVEYASSAAPDMSSFEVRQEWFTSKDGTRVPMFIVARKDLVRDGRSATILSAYGASQTSELPSFRPEVVAWVHMGGVYAIANVRGGGEFGKVWYESAIRKRKQTSFDDLIAASEHLIQQGWTRPSKLGILGGSNGGLLVSATMLQRPELFGAVLADVPVTDAMRRHLSGNGPQQIEQWGTPDDPSIFPALQAYSPVHNVTEGRCYPATLITTARDDQRIPPWHAYKFAAALQAGQSCPAPIMLHVRESGGHGGGDIGGWLDGLAGRLSFAASQLGLEPSSGSTDGQ